MRGWFKAKDSYKDIPEDESYMAVAFRKHNALLRGEVIYLETAPRLMGKDFSEHLEACEEPIKKSAPKSPPIQWETIEKVAEEVVEEAPEKSAEPSDDWTKDEIKAYMDDNSIEYNSGDTKSDLISKANEGGTE